LDLSNCHSRTCESATLCPKVQLEAGFRLRSGMVASMFDQKKPS
jgi:hypothetical protein